MQDVLTLISQLNRPALLVRTARHALDDYDRVVHLRRVLKTENVPGPAQAILRLMDLEAAVEDQRRGGRAEYSVAHHINLIIALMSEARILRASHKKRAARVDAPHTA